MRRLAGNPERRTKRMSGANPTTSTDDAGEPPLEALTSAFDRAVYCSDITYDVVYGVAAANVMGETNEKR